GAIGSDLCVLDRRAASDRREKVESTAPIFRQHLERETRSVGKLLDLRRRGARGFFAAERTGHQVQSALEPRRRESERFEARRERARVAGRAALRKDLKEQIARTRFLWPFELTAHWKGDRDARHALGVVRDHVRANAGGRREQRDRRIGRAERGSRELEI